jgi:dihydropteroate synthase
MLTFPPVWGERTYIMGILNITPDSFSGDGLLVKGGVEAALEQARRFVAAGADILDIGGESTRPGSQPVSAEEERERILPVIRAIRAAGLDTLISVDTYKAAVAEAAHCKPAPVWVNDVWGSARRPRPGDRWSPDRAYAVVLMHNRSHPAKRGGARPPGWTAILVGPTYVNLLEDVQRESARLASTLARRRWHPR